MSAENRIKELRKKAGLSQEKLGEEVGCNKSKISKLERGDQELTKNWMVRIAKALRKHGLTIAASDLLPTEHAFRDEQEKDTVETLRALRDSGNP